MQTLLSSSPFTEVSVFGNIGRMPPTLQDRKLTARRIKRALEVAGVSQADLVRHFDKASSAINKWVHGVNQPSLEEFAELCRLTDVSADEILGLPPRGPARLPDQAAAQLVAQVRKLQQRREAVTDEIEDLLRLLQGLAKK